MNKLWRKSGTVAFWLSYPLLQIYLRIGWRTRVLVICDGDLLVVKGWLGDGRGWQLPGGGAHRGEPQAEAACRELYEEAGVKVKPTDLKLLYQGRSTQYGLSFRYSCYAVVLAKKPTLRKQAWEITEIDWLPLEEVTKDNVSQVTHQAVQAWSKR